MFRGDLFQRRNGDKLFTMCARNVFRSRRGKLLVLRSGNLFRGDRRDKLFKMYSGNVFHGRCDKLQNLPDRIYF